ncbi:TadE/TadG family type IV pilus assembly protein [Chelativorans sp. YIM 93263]|uniref:TadE/TadG family type IV pilus assembly protein n=1 Tax=Chelativorans sp. YIM 93263 TaxID=2906648 RepID=UPI002378A01C|nr:TadE/TadG family type IV pilus assembly protein [Chelativorans sp. YIM 93263]
MFLKFARDQRGNYAIITALAMLPILGAVTIAVDYSEVSRQRQVAQNALDATSLAIALSYLDGTAESQVRTFAQDYFEANFKPSDTADPQVSVTLPTGSGGGGTLKTCADLKYPPYFWPAVKMLSGDDGDTTIHYSICSEVRLKNTLEVALVLDNSGSMDYRGFGSGSKRIDLLKDASKQLVETLAGQAGLIQQIDKPVQFGLVPFAASVNIGPQYADAWWMDTDGLSPVHHENFEWTTMKGWNKNKGVEQDDMGIYRKNGRAWNREEGEKVTRFTLFDNQHHIRWGGCVEARPYPHNVEGTVPTRSDPVTLFVPMFAPDETDKKDGNRPANNNWLADKINESDRPSSRERQEYMPKYFNEQAASAAREVGKGPNLSCTTAPITPLTDVTEADGLEAIKAAIDAMWPLGSTNVPQGIEWGWHVISSAVPFTEGRDDNNKGNDKVVIVLTDGANTYYTPESIRAEEYSGSGWQSGGNDLAENRSIYSAYGYAHERRIFAGTRVSGFNNGRYSEAMNEHMLELCQTAKDENVILMTVSLDLDRNKRDEREQIEALEECASESRFRTDGNGNAIKLFWNTRGDELSETFKEIADELSNLRLVS